MSAVFRSTRRRSGLASKLPIHPLSWRQGFHGVVESQNRITCDPRLSLDLDPFEFCLRDLSCCWSRNGCRTSATGSILHEPTSEISCITFMCQTWANQFSLWLQEEWEQVQRFDHSRFSTMEMSTNRHGLPKQLRQSPGCYRQSCSAASQSWQKEALES